ncbi:EamA family transporter RarD [bacterium]|nr:EamA family transporter RarD [bacterium]
MYGLLAYGGWGFVTIYFKAVAHIPALEVLAHRALWSFILLIAIVLVLGEARTILRVFRDWRTLLALVATATLVSINWLTFIWSVAHERVIQAALGYFMNPLVNVLLGALFLGERLRRWQVVSLFCALAGILAMTTLVGTVPWVSFILAFSFGLYGLIRKVARIGALGGLTVETLLMLPIAVGYVGWLMATHESHFAAGNGSDTILLVAAGIVTAVPLLWFAGAARRLKYTTVGFIQYIAPSLQFLLGWLLYKEPFGTMKFISFLLIWLGLAIFTWDALRRTRRR